MANGAALRDLTWVAAKRGQPSPLNYALVEVELEQSHRRLTLGREWLDNASSKDEVILPTLPSRVEEADERAAPVAERADVAPFPCVASKTSVGKVVSIRSSAMFAADDVVYLMRRIRIVFMKEAILTSVAGAFGDEST